MFTDKKRKGINRFVCDVSLYVAKTPKASIKYHKLPLPVIPFGIVAYVFVGQPFSKQLYSQARSFPDCLFSVEVVMAHKPLHHSKALNQLRTVQWFSFGIFFGCCIAKLYDGLRKLAPICHAWLIRSQSKANGDTTLRNKERAWINRDSLALVFPRLASATCIC